MDVLRKTIYDLEASLLTPEVRHSRDRLDELLAADFKEFGSSGRTYSKEDVLKRLPAVGDQVEFSLSDFRITALSDECVLATFKTVRAINGKDPVTSLRSSIWKKDANQWRMIFHQGTPVHKD